MSLTAALLALASATLPAADSVAINRQVFEIYRPYTRPMTSTSPWERPIFTGEINALVRQWRSVTPQVQDVEGSGSACAGCVIMARAPGRLTGRC